MSPLIDPNHLSPTGRRILPRNWDNMTVNFVPGPSPLPALMPFVDAALATYHAAPARAALISPDAVNQTAVDAALQKQRASLAAMVGAPYSGETK